MSTDRAERRRDIRVVGLLVLLLTLLYFDVLFLGNNFFTRDLAHYHYPMKKVVRDTILDGHFPAWNPWFAGGQPMAANPAYEVFYPPQWLTLIPDYNLGFRLHILFHVYLAAIGGFAFLRATGVRRPVAFFGGMAFVLSGPFTSTINLLPFMFSMAWTPWIALFARRFFESRSRFDLSMLILTLGMQSLVCEPTTLLQTWGVLGAWAAWRGWVRGRPRPAAAAVRNLLAAVLVVVAGLLLAAVQFLPALDHAGDSVRREGFAWEGVSQWSFPPLRSAEFVYPSVLGSLEGGGSRYWGFSLYPNVKGPYLYSVYFGLLFAALVVAGIVTRREGAWFVLVTIAASAVLAMGSWTPVLRLLYDSGLLPSVRYPEKFILSGSLVALAWGCVVLDDLLEGNGRIKRVTVTLLLSTALVAGLAFASTFLPGHEAWLRVLLPDVGEGAVRLSRVHWLVAVIRGVAFSAAIVFVCRTRARAALALFGLILLADLGPLGNQINPRMPSRFFDAPQAAVEVKERSAGSRLLHLVWLARDTDVFDRMTQGHDSYWGYRNGLAPTLPAVWGIPTILENDVDETQLIHTRQFSSVAHAYMKEQDPAVGQWRAEAVRQIAGMCNVGVIATSREDDAVPDGVRPEEVEPVVFETVNGGARYYFASEIAIVDGPQEMLDTLASRAWPQSVAFVADSGARAGWGIVHAVREQPGRIELDVEAIGDSTLVASVTRHKYWTASVDGVSVPIRAVNHAFQGVSVPPGIHRVEWRYFNPLIPTGGAISVTIAGGLLWGLWRQRR